MWFSSPRLLFEGVSTLYQYDQHFDLPVKITDPHKKSVAYTFDELGNVRKYQDERDQVTLYDYDIMERLTKIVTPQNICGEYTYNSLGLMTKKVLQDSNNLKQSICISYDDFFRLKRITNTLGQWTQFAYKHDQISEIRSSDCTLVQLEYKAGKLVTEKHNGEIRFQYAYDRNHNLIAVTNIRGKCLLYTKTFLYDEENKLIRQSNDINVVRWLYEEGALAELRIFNADSDYIFRFYGHHMSDPYGYFYFFDYDENGYIASLIRGIRFGGGGRFFGGGPRFRVPRIRVSRPPARYNLASARRGTSGGRGGSSSNGARGGQKGFKAVAKPVPKKMHHCKR